MNSFVLKNYYFDKLQLCAIAFGILKKYDSFNERKK